MAESGSVTGILEAYTNADLKAKLDKLDALLKAVDAHSKTPMVLSSFFK